MPKSAHLLDHAHDEELVGHVEDEGHPVAVDRNQEREEGEHCRFAGGVLEQARLGLEATVLRQVRINGVDQLGIDLWRRWR